MADKDITELHIAGWNTSNDWRELRANLRPGRDANLWAKAFKEYFLQRLELRYLEPIRTLQKHGTYRGEGFSIVALQCTLIEFLESTIRGTNFRYLKKGDTLGPYEYSSSGELFVAFLSERTPFSKAFGKESGFDFYIGVRCGLLHEARTKNDWTIWAKNLDGLIANAAKRIVYRDNFQIALESFIEDYGLRLLRDETYQEAFLRKFDKLVE